MLQVFIQATVFLFLLLLMTGPAAAQQLPPVPVPPENPITEAKRVLGKILFWEEQLSSDDTVACGTCHAPSSGGADARVGVHPGSDGNFDTPDDVIGSPGVVRRDVDGTPIDDPTFGLLPQVTGRAAPSNFANLFAPEQFWDGRAGRTFSDPLDPSTVVIADGGGLENQAIGPILSSVEMARDGRGWADVTAKLEISQPLGLAVDWPADVASAIAADPSYGDLFQTAFGDPEITPVRIGFAIATYERTLVPDQTPWDAFAAGNNNALTPQQRQGWDIFRNNGSRCDDCHRPPMFTDNNFHNLGLRPAAEDEGRRAVTGNQGDFGDMKTPSLRNIALRTTLMHTGGIIDIADALDFYTEANGHQHFTADQDGIPPNGAPLDSIRIPRDARVALIDFLTNGLTDPRVAAGAFPFDRPTLASEIDDPGETSTSCAATAMTACRTSIVPGRTRFVLKDDADDSRDRMYWKWTKGEATAAGDLGDPTGTDGYAVCLYDGSDADQLIFEARAPAGPSWKLLGSATNPKGFKYKDRDGTPDGISKLQVKAGADGKAKIVLKAAGANLSASPLGMPTTPMPLPLIVQVQGAGNCWEAEYTSAAQNAGGAFDVR